MTVCQPAPDAEDALLCTLDVQKRLDLLPKNCRALALALADGYSGREALAARLGLTGEQVRVRLESLQRMAACTGWVATP